MSKSNIVNKIGNLKYSPESNNKKYEDSDDDQENEKWDLSSRKQKGLLQKGKKLLNDDQWDVDEGLKDAYVITKKIDNRDKEIANSQEKDKTQEQSSNKNKESLNFNSLANANIVGGTHLNTQSYMSVESDMKFNTNPDLGLDIVQSNRRSKKDTEGGDNRAATERTDIKMVNGNHSDRFKMEGQSDRGNLNQKKSLPGQSYREYGSRFQTAFGDTKKKYQVQTSREKDE